MKTEQLARLRNGNGFIAALDQSGGSTPKALRLYGISEGAYRGEDEMFDLVHDMRSRIITSPVFDGDRILAAILFEQTLDRQCGGVDTAQYLWARRRIVPILKVDQGLAEEANGVQLMKPLDKLNILLERALDKGVFGTKMRSVIHSANEAGVREIVDQQFKIGKTISDHGLVPILEPEVNINSDSKAQAERLLKRALLSGLDGLGDDEQVIFKLTLPSHDGFYTELVEHRKVVRVVALSGGYERSEANARLTKNPGVIASFSRALTEGLSAQQSDEEFNTTLDASIQSIYDASMSSTRMEA